MAKIKVRIVATQQVYYDQVVEIEADEVERLSKMEEYDPAYQARLAELIDPTNVSGANDIEDAEFLLPYTEPTLPAEQRSEGGV